MRYALRLLAAAVLGAALSPPAIAAEPDAATDLLAVSCGDFMRGLELANPGPKATAEQKRVAQEAQDDIATGLLWVHGYLAGRQGTNASPPVLTRKWMTEYVPKLAQGCQRLSPDGKMRLADVVAKL